MKVVERNISELIPAEYNPRYITEEALEQLKASIQRFDTVEPVLVNMHPDRKNIIISGHQRIKAAKSLGLDTFPCVELDLDKEKERELNVRMNKNTGAWDWDELATYFDVDELTEWGFTEEELFGDGDFEEDVEAEEDDYEVPEEIQTDFVLGDLIEIGEHRLLCGDSTDSDQVAKLMDGEKADMVFTDPPYGMDFKGEVFGKNGIKNDRDSDWESVLKGAFSNMIAFSKDALFAICFSPARLDRFFKCTEGLNFKRILTIYKPNRMGFPWRGWILTSEIIALFENGTPKYIEKNHKHDVYTFDYSERPDKNIDHPTIKPLSIVSDVISKSEGVNVLDLFLGSATTMVACHQLKRKCYGMELDPKYCQVIVDRMLKLDSSLEVKVNGEPYGV